MQRKRRQKKDSNLLTNDESTNEEISVFSHTLNQEEESDFEPPVFVGNKKKPKKKISKVKSESDESDTEIIEIADNASILFKQNDFKESEINENTQNLPNVDEKDMKIFDSLCITNQIEAPKWMNYESPAFLGLMEETLSIFDDKLNFPQ